MIIDILIATCTVAGTLVHNRTGPLTQMLSTIRLIRVIQVFTKTLMIITALESCTIRTLRQTASPNVCLALTTALPWLS